MAGGRGIGQTAPGAQPTIGPAPESGASSLLKLGGVFGVLWLISMLWKPGVVE